MIREASCGRFDLDRRRIRVGIQLSVSDRLRRWFLVVRLHSAGVSYGLVVVEFIR